MSAQDVQQRSFYEFIGAIILSIILYQVGRKNPFVIKNKYIIFLICCLVTGIVQTLIFNYRNNSTDENIENSTIYKISQIILALLYASAFGSALIAFSY